MISERDLLADYNALREELRAQGLFASSPWWVWSEVAFIIAAFATGAWLRVPHPAFAFTLMTVAGITLVWWIHDAGHDAYFASKTHAKLWIEVLGIAFLGMPQIEYHYGVHRRHHGFTNVIGKDSALATGPIVWHPKMINEKVKKPVRFQAFIWLALVLPMTWPLINSRCILDLYKQNSYARLVLLAARWVAAAFILGFSPTFLFGPILITGFVLGFAASLNHFHMPISDCPLAKFPASVYLTTQNLGHDGWFWTWITGGLNFHIEHHLFPTMPSRNYAKVAPQVLDLARRHDLPYQVCSGPEAVHRLCKRLSNPLGTGTVKRSIRGESV